MSYVVQKDFCKVQGIAGDFVIPKGNTKSLGDKKVRWLAEYLWPAIFQGAFDSCLETHWPHESFATKYCAVRISGTHNPGSNVVKPAYRLAYMPSWMPSNREDLTIEVWAEVKDRKGCNSKNVTESLNLWPHLGDGVSLTRPESQSVQGRSWLEQFDSRAEFRRLHHQGVARNWETHWHFCCYTLHIFF